MALIHCISWIWLKVRIEARALEHWQYWNRIVEYEQARQWIAESLDFDSSSVDKYNSHFEVTIRILGGLLSIYHLTGDEIYLKRAVRTRPLRSWIHLYLDGVRRSTVDQFRYTLGTTAGWNKYPTKNGQRLSVDRWFSRRDEHRFPLDGHRIRLRQK